MFQIHWYESSNTPATAVDYVAVAIAETSSFNPYRDLFRAGLIDGNLFLRGYSEAEGTRFSKEG